MMDEARPDIVCAIVGPTAAGKTEISLAAAEASGAEIVSVDSRQIYRYLDIGTDKVSIEARMRVPHHMIDIADPDETVTAADYTSAATAAVSRIRARGKIPLLVGGTPMYYRALEGRLLTADLPTDMKLRAEIERTIDERGISDAYDRLSAADQEAARKIHPNDRVRIVRYLELATLLEMPATEFFKKSAKIGGLKICYIGIRPEKEILHRRIRERIEAEFASGFEDEVRWLLKNGYRRDLPVMRGLSYRQMVDYIDGRLTKEEAVDEDVRATKNFSKRQMTWFKQFFPIIWYDVLNYDRGDISEDIARRISELETYASDASLDLTEMMRRWS